MRVSQVNEDRGGLEHWRAIRQHERRYFSGGIDAPEGLKFSGTSADPDQLIGHADLLEYNLRGQRAGVRSAVKLVRTVGHGTPPLLRASQLASYLITTGKDRPSRLDVSVCEIVRIEGTHRVRSWTRCS